MPCFKRIGSTYPKNTALVITYTSKSRDTSKTTYDVVYVYRKLSKYAHNQSFFQNTPLHRQYILDVALLAV